MPKQVLAVRDGVTGNAGALRCLPQGAPRQPMTDRNDVRDPA